MSESRQSRAGMPTLDVSAPPRVISVHVPPMTAETTPEHELYTEPGRCKAALSSCDSTNCVLEQCPCVSASNWQSQFEQGNCKRSSG